MPGEPTARVRWSAAGGRPLPSGAVDNGDGTLTIASVGDAHIGGYICSTEDPNSGRNIESPEARIDLNAPLRPLIDPQDQVSQK